MPPVAYSYLRFSSPQQASGDSIRRQVEKTADWCRRHNVQLDTSMTLRDEGVSAFKGKHRDNPDMHALAAFMNAVKAGRVPAGSFLVVESLDRLTREKIRPALTLLLNLIEAGVKVVQLIPVEATYDEDVEPMQLMQAIMELNRGHSESKVKSERVGAAWAKKRQQAGEKVVTRKLPGWIRYDDGKLKLDPAGAATVRRIFNMCLTGNGVHAIALTLNTDRVPVMGRKVFKGRPIRWTETVVYHVLRSRATYGEFQPSKGRGSERVPVGEPVADYFPAAISRDTFLRAQAAMKSRTKQGSGRRGRHVNLFAGLLKDARDGGSLTYKHLKKRPSTIIPVGAKKGTGAVWSSFQADVLERAVRSKLAEVKTADIAGDNPTAERVEALSARKAELTGLIAAWEAKMGDVKIVDVVAANLSKLSGQLEAVNAELAEAQREAANPLSEAWGEARTLAGMDPDDDTDEKRLRIKAALRRCISGIYCLFLGDYGDRVAAVQVWFTNGAQRSYVILHRPRHLSAAKRQPKPLVNSNADAGKHETGKASETACRSFQEFGLPKGRDLREPKDAIGLERLILKCLPVLGEKEKVTNTNGGRARKVS